MKTRALLAGVVLLLLAATPTFATPITSVSTNDFSCTSASPGGICAGSFDFLSTLTTYSDGTYSLTLKITDLATGGINAYVDGLSFSVFTGGVTITGITPNTWEYIAGNKINNGSGQCDTNNQTGSVCMDDKANDSLAVFLTPGNFATFEFDGSLNGASILDTFHLMANAKDSITGRGNGNAFALSNDVTFDTCTGDCNLVPEPASLGLMGSGLLALAFGVRRKFVK